MKPKDVTDIKYVEYSEETNKKLLNLESVIMSEFQSIKIFLLKVIHLTGVKKFLLLIKYKTLFLGLI